MRLLNFSVVGRSSDTWGHPRRSEEGIEEEDRSTKRKQNKQDPGFVASCSNGGDRLLLLLLAPRSSLTWTEVLRMLPVELWAVNQKHAGDLPGSLLIGTNSAGWERAREKRSDLEHDVPLEAKNGSHIWLFFFNLGLIRCLMDLFFKFPQLNF